MCAFTLPRPPDDRARPVNRGLLCAVAVAAVIAIIAGYLAISVDRALGQEKREYEAQLGAFSRLSMKAAPKVLSNAGRAGPVASKAASKAAPAPVAMEQAKVINHPAELFQRHPELRSAFLAAFSGGVDLRYRDFYSSRKLTPEQVATFNRIMNEYEAKWTALTAEGLSITDPKYIEINQPDREQKKMLLSTLLGQEGYEELVKFDRNIGSRKITSDIIIDLRGTAEELSLEQARKLTDALAENTVAKDERRNPASATKANYDAAMARAAEFLSPSQLAALRANLEAQAADQEIRKLRPAGKRPSQ